MKIRTTVLFAALASICIFYAPIAHSQELDEDVGIDEVAYCGNGDLDGNGVVDSGDLDFLRFYWTEMSSTDLYNLRASWGCFEPFVSLKSRVCGGNEDCVEYVIDETLSPSSADSLTVLFNTSGLNSDQSETVSSAITNESEGYIEFCTSYYQSICERVPEMTELLQIGETVNIGSICSYVYSKEDVLTPTFERIAAELAVLYLNAKWRAEYGNTRIFYLDGDLNVLYLYRDDGQYFEETLSFTISGRNSKAWHIYAIAKARIKDVFKRMKAVCDRIH